MARRRMPNSSLPYADRPIGAKKSPAQKERDKARKERDFARKYHSPERVWWVGNALACVVPECRARDNENAHVEGGGVGRKADYTAVAPICKWHHRALHNMGHDTFEAEYGVDLEQAAKLTEEAWQMYGADVVARAKADGRFDRWQKRDQETDAA